MNQIAVKQDYKCNRIGVSSKSKWHSAVLLSGMTLVCRPKVMVMQVILMYLSSSTVCRMYKHLPFVD